MCGRYIINYDDKPSEMHKIIEEVKNHKPVRHTAGYEKMKTGEIFPSDYAPVIIPASDNKINAVVMKWGFKFPHKNTLVINARYEGIRERPIFKNAINRHRCIIPTNGYFEWKTDGKTKEKYHISAQNTPTLYLAGIYDFFDTSNSDEKEFRFVIITRPAQGIIASLHSRMPMQIEKRDILKWMNGGEQDEFYFADLPDLSFKSAEPSMFEQTVLI